MASKKVLIDIEVRDVNAISNTKRAATEVDKLAKSQKRLAKTSQDNRAQSGLNNAILIETGRVASDASFGIQGIANNISRLIELGQEFARTNKTGLAGALADLKKSFFGVGGILIAIQLVISFLPKLIKKFQESRDKAKGLSKAVKELRADFFELKQAIEESNEALVEQDENIETLITRLGRAVKFNVMFRFAGDTTFIDETIERLRLLGVEIDRSELLRFKHDPQGLNEYIAELIDKNKGIPKLTQEIIDMRTALEVDKITGDITPVDAARKELEIFIKTQEAFGIEQEKYFNEPKYKKLVAKVEIARRQAEKEARDKLLEEQTKETGETIERLLTGRKEGHEDIFAEMVNGMTFQQIKAQELLVESGKASNNEFKKFAKNYQETQDAIARHHQIAEDMKVEASLRTVDTLFGISDMLFALGEQSKSLQIAAIIAEKAGAIGDVIIRTRAANTKIALQGSEGALFTGGLSKIAAKGLILANNIASAVSIGAIAAQASQSISQIRSGSGAGGGSIGGGAGSGGAVQAPNFNIVGASRENQLARAVTGERDKPIRAFVVASDLTEVVDENNTNTETSKI